MLTGSLVAVAGFYLARFFTGMFYAVCKRKARSSLWCERRIVNEARRRHDAFVRLIPEGHTLVIRGTAMGDITVTANRG